MHVFVHKRVLLVDDTGGFRFAQRKSKIFRTLSRVLVPAFTHEKTPQRVFFRGGRSGTRCLWGELRKSAKIKECSDFLLCYAPHMPQEK